MAMRLVSALAMFAAACALALVVAYWGWQLFGPAIVHVAAPAPANPGATIIAASLFRGSGAAGAPSTVSPGAGLLAGDTRLLGIIAEPRQQGYALFRLPSGPKLVAQGQEIAAGATLVSVQADAITVRDAAGERRFVLREGASSLPAHAAKPASSAARSAAPGAVSRVAAAGSCAPPAGFQGSVIRLNAELLGGLSGEAGPWRTLLAPAAGGLVVREDGGFGAMLGLKSGDRIAQANGIALTVPDDVTSTVIRPLVANQGVRLVGSREGIKHELWLANMACAG
jgi:hypothetical protein